MGRMYIFFTSGRTMDYGNAELPENGFTSDGTLIIIDADKKKKHWINLRNVERLEYVQGKG